MKIKRLTTLKMSSLTNRSLPIKKHHTLILLCIVAMILPFFLARFTDSSWLGYIAFALCPLLHIWMMKSGNSCHADHDKKDSRNAIIKQKKLDA